MLENKRVEISLPNDYENSSALKCLNEEYKTGIAMSSVDEPLNPS